MEKIINLFNHFFKNENNDLNILGKLLTIVLIFIFFHILNFIIKKIIDKSINNKYSEHFFKNKKVNTLEQALSNKRANTLAQVLKKINYFLLIFIWLMISLDLFNVPTASILATAGIGGLAIGFGAQSLVKDVITGFFILLENQYSVGDLVKIEAYEGVVEEIGLRVTKLRSPSGDLNIIPNSRIGIVVNKTRGEMRAKIEVTIAYEENIDNVIEVLQKALGEVKEEKDYIISGPTVQGVTDLGDHGYNLAIVAKTQAMKQWGLERELRKKVKETLEKANIEIPYSKIVIVEDQKK